MEEKENNGEMLATEKQLSYIDALLKGGLTKAQASVVIDILNARRPSKPRPQLEPKTPSQYKPRENKDIPATEKQKNFLREIYATNDVEFDERHLDSLTMKQASEIISSYIGGGGQ